MTMPETPFSTSLSCSARETKLRIRNIFRKKKRPDVIALLIAVALIPLCGSVVAFQPRPRMPEIVMEVQYYDERGNYIEIPTLSMPDGEEPTEGVAAINQALAELTAEYQPVFQLPADPDAQAVTSQYENLCLLYPCVTSRYLNLVFFRDVFHTDLNTGHALTLVYDRETGRQVTLEDALTLAGTSEAELFARLSAQIDPEINNSIALSWDSGLGIRPVLRVQNPALEGFRIRENGTVVFYLTARVDDADDMAADYVSGADHLYIYQDGVFSDCYADAQYAYSVPGMVPAEELEALNPPLRCQWPAESQEENGVQDARRLNAYISALENLCYHLVFPDGRVYDAYDSGTSRDQFAIYDVDQDGKDELIVLCGNTYVAGMTGAIYGYDENTGALFEEFSQYPAFDIYDNGIIQAYAAHNQGPAGDALWPYALWQYDRESDSYFMIAFADAWDKSLVEVYGGEAFPDEADQDGDGIVYNVGEHSGDGPAYHVDRTEYSARYVDKAEYDQWLAAYLGGARKLDIPYVSLTGENIDMLRNL